MRFIRPFGFLAAVPRTIQHQRRHLLVRQTRKCGRPSALRPLVVDRHWVEMARHGRCTTSHCRCSRLAVTSLVFHAVPQRPLNYFHSKMIPPECRPTLLHRGSKTVVCRRHRKAVNLRHSTTRITIFPCRMHSKASRQDLAWDCLDQGQGH